jgi:hypothetical protein
MAGLSCRYARVPVGLRNFVYYAPREHPGHRYRPPSNPDPVVLRSFIPHLLTAFVGLILTSGCGEGSGSRWAENPHEDASGLPIAMERGKILERDGKVYLWGGKEPSWDFDASDLEFDLRRLHFGLGRENFPALFRPEFQSRLEADRWLPDTARVLVVDIQGDVRVYPHRLMLRHELVNDVVGGIPVFAAYCILSDLGAIYERTYGGHIFTFGLSGFTYYDPDVYGGRDGFILWDRDTESLWWPLIGKAVSGPMKGVPLKVYDESSWMSTHWSTVKARYEHPLVLAPGQELSPPPSWPKVDVSTLDLAPTTESAFPAKSSPVKP